MLHGFLGDVRDFSFVQPDYGQYRLTIFQTDQTQNWTKIHIIDFQNKFYANAGKLLHLSHNF